MGNQIIGAKGYLLVVIMFEFRSSKTSKFGLMFLINNVLEKERHTRYSVISKSFFEYDSVMHLHIFGNFSNKIIHLLKGLINSKELARYV